MLVVMTCMIVCSVLFDSSGEVEADSTSKESDVEAASSGDHHARAYADTHP